MLILLLLSSLFLENTSPCSVYQFCLALQTTAQLQIIYCGFLTQFNSVELPVLSYLGPVQPQFCHLTEFSWTNSAELGPAQPQLVFPHILKREYPAEQSLPKSCLFLTLMLIKSSVIATPVFSHSNFLHTVVHYSTKCFSRIVGRIWCTDLCPCPTFLGQRWTNAKEYIFPERLPHSNHWQEMFQSDLMLDEIPG